MIADLFTELEPLPGTSLREGPTLLVHPYCPSSFRVVKYVLERGLTHLVKIVPVTSRSPLRLGVVVPSVPAIAVAGRVVAVDPLEPEFVEEVALGRVSRRFLPVEPTEVLDRFSRSLKASSFLMCSTYLGGLMVSDVVETEFADAATRTYFTKLDSSYVRGVLKEHLEELEGAIAESGAKAVAYSYVRDLVVSVGSRLREYVTLENLRLWAVAKLSQGMAFYPLELSAERLREVLNYLQENLENLAGRVEEYLRTLEAEPEVRKALTEGS